tara:strand:- start:161 stop:700 length:540 start_codon:yes stop_codon:yes gene_type:complete
MRTALFLDRDGTIIDDVHYLSDPDCVSILPGAGEALIRAKKEGFLVFLFTNQSGIGRGYFGLDVVEACNRRMLDLIGVNDDFFDDICIAPETPDEPLLYRKPSPRFVLETIEKHDLKHNNCFTVGDKWSDAMAGLDAGVRGTLVETGQPIDERTRILATEYDVGIYRDLSAFINSLMKS